MKTLLIVFIVLLFLLTLLSSFGGSIRPKEPFYDDVPAYEPERFELPNPEHYETFNTNENGYNPANEYFYENATGATPSTSPSPSPSPSSEAEKKEDGGVLSTEIGSPTSKVSTPAPEGFMELIKSYEKFEVPEPFMNEDHASTGAPF